MAQAVRRSFHEFADEAIQRCRKRRQELGLSQNELDARIGCAEGLVAKWESGARRPGPFLLYCWLDSLGLGTRIEAVAEVLPPRRATHGVEARVREGERRLREGGHPARPCNAYIRGDAPANPYEP